MPDTYKTFLSPGSCQLEVTDLVASANDDKGVDLYGVAWEIEQVLIAGEGFAASPTDVWVNERGILNVGKSLFDKINRTAEDNDNIPGQCTVVVKATSLVDSSKVARLKVLVGYPGEGGGGGGGDSDFSTATVSLTLPNSNLISVNFTSFIDEEEAEFATIAIAQESGNLPFIMYKGSSMIDVYYDEAGDPDQFTFSSSGDIEPVTGPGSYLATGNCAITIAVK